MQSKNNYSRNSEAKILVFDWGNTLMNANYPYDGSMADWPEVSLMPGILQGLEKLPAAVKIIATNAGASDAELVRKALKRVRLDTHFELIFTSKELNALKPQIEFFKGIEDVLNKDSQDFVMIGDGYKNDILGAYQAGWKTLWYNPAMTPAPGLLPLHNGELYDLCEMDTALQNLSLPDLQTCLAWQIEHDFSNNLWMHSQSVAGVAYVLALWLKQKGEQVNPILTHRGGLLHDLAKLETLANPDKTLDHGQAAAVILREKGQPELAEIANRHMIFCPQTKDRQHQTWEQVLVYFADKLIEGNQIVSLEDRMAALNKRYGMRDNLLPVMQSVQEKVCKHIERTPEEMLIELKAWFFNNNQ